MPKTRPPYAAEFRQQMIDLVRSGRAPEDLAREFEPSSLRIPVKPITRSGGKPITCRSEATRDENHESRFPAWVDGRVRFRIESPFRASL